MVKPPVKGRRRRWLSNDTVSDLRPLCGRFFGIAVADCGWLWLIMACCGLAMACCGLAMACCGLAMAYYGLPYGLMTFVFDQLIFNSDLAIIKL